MPTDPPPPAQGTQCRPFSHSRIGAVWNQNTDAWVCPECNDVIETAVERAIRLGPSPPAQGTRVLCFDIAESEDNTVFFCWSCCRSFGTPEAYRQHAIDAHRAKDLTSAD